MGMAWKEALKRLKDYCAGDTVGEPSAMKAELEGLEESLKGWELRDEHRERGFNVYRDTDVKVRKERDDARSEVAVLKEFIHRVYGTLDAVLHSIDADGSRKNWLPGLMEEALEKLGIKTKS